MAVTLRSACDSRYPPRCSMATKSLLCLGLMLGLLIVKMIPSELQHLSRMIKRFGGDWADA